jgi:hypothetical protein
LKIEEKMSASTSLADECRITANTAVYSQISTLSEADRTAVISRLASFIDAVLGKIGTLPDYAKLVPGPGDLVEIRIDPQLRALVELDREGGVLKIVSLARPEQIEPYAKTFRRSA